MYGLLASKLVYRKVESTFFMNKLSSLSGKRICTPGTGGIQGLISSYKFLVPCLSVRVKFTNQ